jgi:hypothetical protein
VTDTDQTPALRRLDDLSPMKSKCSFLCETRDFCTDACGSYVVATNFADH